MRDISSGTAPQEVNVWLSLKWVFEGMETRLRSEEVGMVMDALRNAKRFHATVGFIADTGLKDATDFGGSLFFVCIYEADRYWQSPSATD